MGREGLKAFILDIITASPPLLVPPSHAGAGGYGVSNGESSRSSASAVQPQQTEKEKGRASIRAASAAPQPNLERELDGVLAKMAAVVLNEVSEQGTGAGGEGRKERSHGRVDRSIVVFVRRSTNA